MKTALWLGLAMALVLTGTALAQGPVRPVDIRADSVLVILHFPEPDSLRVVFCFTIHDIEEPSVHHDSWVMFSLDGRVVFTQPISFSSTSSAACNNDPSCSARCEIQLSGGQVTWDHCSWWTTWTGVGCDPTDPAHTCQPLNYCACGAQFVVTSTIPYEDEHMLKAEVDGPPYPNQVDEADETNNAVYMTLAPVATKSATWGIIKSLYK